MCGIVGAVGGNVENVKRSLEIIKRRGPDATSISEFPGVVFGHNRLSIIDLAECANQPMLSENERYVIVFNGEIYNYQEIKEIIGQEYKWQTHSDTEVILASYMKWGEKCLEHLRGMFSFCIWDITEQKIFGARDRLGVKPFYYRQMGEKFFFGSRPDAVISASGQQNVNIDNQAVRYFLEAGYIPAPLTIYQELKKLSPGHKLNFSKGILKIEKYWSLDQIETNEALSNASEEQLLAELDEKIRESVRLRMISDVPVGVFLSGGIDSSLVAAVMATMTDQPVKSFSIGFADPDFDESHHAKAVAIHLKTDHNEQKFEIDDLLQFMPDFLSQYDEPFFDYSAFPVMAVSKLARSQVKVALSGDGGDEAFGGYHYYKLMGLADQLQKWPYALRILAGKIVKFFPQHKAKLLSGFLNVEGRTESYAFLRSVIKGKTNIFSKEMLKTTKGLDKLFLERTALMPKNLSGPELGMRLDIAYTLPDDYLQKVDVGSMAFSLEARDPLLDHKLFEWAAQLPLSWKIRGTNKYLLRKLAYKYIPQEILDRPKMGFGVPMAKWLRGPLKSWVDPLINDSEGLAKLGLVPSEVQALWKSHLNNRTQSHTLIWSVAVLQAFRKERPWL
ncbi:MAG: asparagine synthase (glutamine-hydrolyzing) [Bdellovibrio sp.]|nr:asparagine synthase (glutamine-hydrolyzing) [Bdellovibrio sp.]